LAVLAPARRDGRPLPQHLAASVHAYRGAMAIPGRRVARAVERAARAEGTSRVLFGTPWPLALIGPSLRARGLRYATVVHGAELLVPAALPGTKGLLTRALEGADLLLAVSNFTAAKLAALLHSPPPIAVLRAHVDLERFRPATQHGAIRARLGLGEDDKIVLFLGRLVPRKGAQRLLRALPRIAARCPGAVVVVAGSGPQERRLRRLARGRRDVVFAGRVPHEDAPALVAAAAVFALPVSDRWWGLDTEGLGVSLLEAQACGVPCVAGVSGGTSEAVIDDETGFVVDARDGARLASAIAFLIANPEHARRMGANGRAHVAHDFSERPLPEALVDWLGAAPYDA
jgi:phosphatidylinositol alpha-1,6-mannosyltransferase